jgi:C_GCAxxG_C_C family probable redox protein
MVLAVGERYLEDLGPACAWVTALTRIATGFSGGLGDTREELCGALSGGVMVIGALFGRSNLAEDDQPAVDLAERYRRRFLETLGYTQCTALREQVVDAPGGPGTCGELVERAAMILMSLLDEAGEGSTSSKGSVNPAQT